MSTKLHNPNQGRKAHKESVRRFCKKICERIAIPKPYDGYKSARYCRTCKKWSLIIKHLIICLCCGRRLKWTSRQGNSSNQGFARRMDKE